MLYKVLLLTALASALLMAGCPKAPEPGAGLSPEEMLAPGEGQGDSEAPAAADPAAGG